MTCTTFNGAAFAAAPERAHERAHKKAQASFTVRVSQEVRIPPGNATPVPGESPQALSRLTTLNNTARGVHLFDTLGESAGLLVSAPGWHAPCTCPSMERPRRRKRLRSRFSFSTFYDFALATALAAAITGSLADFSPPDSETDPPHFGPSRGISPLTAQIALTPKNPPKTQAAVAEVPASCQIFMGMLKRSQNHLSEKLRNQGLSLFTDSSLAPFSRDPELEEKRRQIRWIETLPEPCRKPLRAALGYTPRVRVVAWTQLGDQADPYASSSAEPRRLLSAYRNLIAEQTFFCPNAGELTSDLTDQQLKAVENCLSQYAVPLYKVARKRLVDQTASQVVAELAASGMPGMSLSDARMIQAFDQILNGSSGEARAYARRHAHDFSEEEWITLAQMFGAKFNEGYDDARNAALLDAKGVVTLDQLLAAGRHNEAVRYYGKDNRASMIDAQWAGVCRDIASAQGEILEATGRFENVFVVSFSTISGSFHVTTLAQSKDALNRVYRLDYGARHDAQSGDSRVLFNGPRDAAIVYRVARPGGRVVGTVQSELGNFLSRAAGGDLRSVDPLARARGTLVAGELDLSSRGTTLVRLGAGQDGLANKYSFVGFTQTWGAQGNFPGRAALVLGVQKRADPAAGDDGTTLDGGHLVFFYTEVEQHFTATGKLADGVYLTTDTTASIVGMLGLGYYNQDAGAFVKDGGARLKQELILVHELTDRTSFVYRVGASISPGIADIRDNSVQMLTPALDTLYGSFEVRHTRKGLTYATQATVAGSDAFGARGRVQVGAAGKRVGGLVGIEGRLGNNAAPFLDGWRRRIFALAQFKPLPQLELTVEGNLYERDKSPPGQAARAGVGLGGSFGIRGEW